MPDTVVKTPSDNPSPLSVLPLSLHLEKKTQKNKPVSSDKPAPKTLVLADKPVLKNKTIPQNTKKSWLSHLNPDMFKLLSFGTFASGLTWWLKHKEENSKNTIKAQAAARQLENAMSNCIITIQQSTLLSQKCQLITLLLNSTGQGNQPFNSGINRSSAEKELIEAGTLYNAKRLELTDNINQLQSSFSFYRSTMDQKKNSVPFHKKEPDPWPNRVLRYYSYLLGRLRKSNPSMMSYKDLEKLEIVQSNLDQLIEKESANIPIYTGYKAPLLLVPPAIIPKKDPGQ